jgi:putative pyruvate formate lyase activating enzyme
MLPGFKKFHLPHYYNILGKKEKPYFQASKSLLIPKKEFEESRSDVSELQKIYSEAVVSKAPLCASGEFSDVSLLDLKMSLLSDWLEECIYCKWKCRVNRRLKKGVCGVSDRPKISSVFLHFGEEEELVPSLTVFFSGCNFRCLYCQNYDIARWPDEGEYIPPERLSEIIENFEKRGALNVNFVGGDPTPAAHYIFHVLKHLDSNLPFIWNSNMYHSEELSEILVGVVDLYLADFKYGNDECARRLSGVKSYFSVVTRNLHKASKTADVIVRHLVLPGHIECCTKPILKWLEENLPDVNLNIMFQYHPCADAFSYGELARRLSFEERQKVVELVEEANLINARVG